MKKQLLFVLYNIKSVYLSFIAPKMCILEDAITVLIATCPVKGNRSAY